MNGGKAFGSVDGVYPDTYVSVEHNNDEFAGTTQARIAVNSTDPSDRRVAMSPTQLRQLAIILNFHADMLESYTPKKEKI